MMPWDQQQYNKCTNPLCIRKVKPSVAYCCDACGRAHEGRYEIHLEGPLAHSVTCDQSLAERGVFAHSER